VGVLTRVWSRLRRSRRGVSSVELLQRAERLRREGRFEDGAALVNDALKLDPRSVLGQLLAGYFHAALRNAEGARAAFRAVLALDPEHPRAMLGLARIAFERGEMGPAQELLERAVRVYPDFPEAIALLEATRAVGAVPAAAPGSASVTARLAQIARPEGARECLFLMADGAVVFAHPATATRDALAAHLARVATLGGATLARAGLGPLRRACIVANPGTTFLVADGRHVLALTLGPDVAAAAGQRQAADLWARFTAAVAA
jgi:tetratricopeptide (TPR) repeat protein